MRDVALMLLVLGLFGLPVYGEVEIPEGFEIVEIVSSEYRTGVPAINNCGQCVFELQLGQHYTTKEIFLYDNGILRRITENDVRDRLADINDRGTIVWSRMMRAPNDDMVILYRDGEETVLDDNRGGTRNASINNLGHVAWARDRRLDCPHRTDLLFWDGETVERISERDVFVDQSPELNDRDEVVWMHTDFCNGQWYGDIRLWSEGRTIALPSSETQIQGASINNIGQVAWDSPPGVEFWENGETVLLIPGGSVPRINDLSDIYFIRWDDDERTWDSWLYRVSNGQPTFYRLSDETPWNTRGDINEYGEVAWHWFGGSGGVRLMRRVRTGDFEFDGDVDLIDYAAFSDCMTGPGRVDRLCDCRFLDIDHDGDVDLGDYALFQEAFSGK